MKSLTQRSVLVLAALLTIASVPAYAGKPLKIYVLSGQSNMQGKARVRTIERLPLTEDSKQMYEDMNVTDGLPSPVKDRFRQAQAAPASMPEFKGNVAAVRTEHYWDMELKRVQEKVNEAAKKKLKAEKPKLGGRALSRAIRKEAKSMAPEVLTPTELKIMRTGKSNAAYHYMGSAYTYGKIGKAFSDAMMELHKAK